MAKIGFIGLGNMGGPMAANLVGAGHEVAAYDLDTAACERLAAEGGRIATDIGDAVSAADAVITMLPAGQHVREVYVAPGGIISAAASGCLLIDSSTIDVASARDVIAAAAEAGFDMIDAPVSGGVGGATAGTLTFMAGGSDAAFTRAKPFLDIMGKTVVHAGGPGTGQAAKICNNMALGISMIGICEAFVLAEKLGLDHQKLFDISSTASAQCWSLTSYCPVPGPVPSSPANRNYAPGFAADMMLKDLRLAQETASAYMAATPLGGEAAALYEKFVSAGEGETDFSGIIKMLRDAAQMPKST